MESGLYKNSIMISEMRDDKLRTWLNNQLGELSHRELARRIGVSHTKVSTFLSGAELAGFEFCIAIARYFRRDPLLILSMAGLVPALTEGKDPSIDEVTQIMRELNRDERRLILDTVRGLRRGFERERESNDK